MAAIRLSPSRRREDIRAWWAEHLAAQRSSGQNQAAYCRARALDPKYFTLWKRKLRDEAGAAPPGMVPVLVRQSDPPTAAVAGTGVGTGSAVALRLNLGNGMSVSLEIAIGVLPAVVRELATLRC